MTPDQVVAPPALLDLYAQMALIRAFESRVAALYRDGAIPGFVHTSLGQEAVAVGVACTLERGDYLATTHRGHGHCLARGVDVDAMMAELFAKASGICKGKGGSMHIADPAKGVIGANAIVGASIPLAVGAGLSSKVLGQGRVSVAFFGEGAVNQGQFHEAVNLAAIWDLPVVLVCENNLYAEFTESARMSRVASVAARAAGYGVEAVEVDGNDVETVAAATAEACSACREGRGPFLIEAMTYRWHGHYEGDQQPYKPAGEVDAWRARDPLAVAADRLTKRVESTPEQLEQILSDAADRVERAVALAQAEDEPPPEEAFTDVFAA
jgi:TPP-dependent pyruvate/acetoin dehydrogenase alpha subunit